MAETIVIACPICMQKIRAPGGVIGKQVKCPQCKNAFTGADPNVVPSQPSTPATRLPEVPAIEPVGWNGSAKAALPPVPVALNDRPRSPFVDFLLLRRAMAPAILVVLFYLVSAGLLVGGIVWAILEVAAVVTRVQPIGIGLLSVLGIFVATIFALIVWRVTCETLAAVFRIHDRLSDGDKSKPMS